MPIKNCFLFLLVLIAVKLPLRAQTKLLDSNQLLEDVGDIKFNPKTDKANFCLCHKDFIIQYYNFGTTYKGGSKAIKSFIYKQYQYWSAYNLITGIITIRFVVNCKGETDRFRVLQMDSNYQKVTFDKGLTKHLLKLCAKLNHWIPGKDNKGNIYDSYYYLNFQIVKGHILNITP
jgi:hypothetical protein